MQTFLQDFRFGIRRLSKKPGFTLIAIITLALAHRRRDVLRLVIGQGMSPALEGEHAKRGGRVSVTDRVTLAVIALTLIAVAALACYIPARRATQVDPMIALRCD